MTTAPQSANRADAHYGAWAALALALVITPWALIGWAIWTLA